MVMLLIITWELVMNTTAVRRGGHDATVCYQFEQGNRSKTMKYLKNACNNGNSQGRVYMQMR